jgi:periplasmic divalent cation tolerance protein
MDEMLLVYTTWPDAETAQAAAEAAIEARLAACANILAPMHSIYEWKGRIEREAEIPMLLKTRSACMPSLRALILRGHPYDTPCVIALPLIAAGSNPEFLHWIKQQTTSEQ